MKDYVIATASTCDLDQTWLQEHNVPMISYTFEIDGSVNEDNCTDASKRLIFSAMRSGTFPNTSQITTYAYYEFFRSLAEDGKTVIFLDMDKAISSSYGNSLNALEQLKEEMPAADIRIIDTRCITIGLGLLVRRAVAMKEDGRDADEVTAWIEANKLKIAHRFMIDDLQWLRHGGRLSNASAIVGTLLAIKPLIYIPDDGSLVAYAKIHGRKKAMHQLIQDTLKTAVPDSNEFVITHSDCPEDAEKFADMLKEQLPEGTPVSIYELGPVIGCHVGPGFIGVVCFTEERKA
jgi:DegV family protein with EDD domain